MSSGKPISRILHYTFGIVSAWTLIITTILVWNIQLKKQTTKALVIKEARSHLNKDKAYRFWATKHGGVYVPTNERTPPNLHLEHLIERDLTTPSGKKLTLMNPAYMLRQMMEEYSELYEIKEHICSLKPLRPQNTPDLWEQSAIEEFEVGVMEVLEFTLYKGDPHLRLMQPIVTSSGCVKCHGIQGYKVGDIRGGISVSVPLLSYLIQERRGIKHLVVTHLFMYLLGVGGISWGFSKVKQRIVERERTDKERDSLIEKLQNALNEIQTLRGIVPICSNCKKIRDDAGYWNQLETYIEGHSEASFSHCMCPSCMDELYGKEDWYIKMKNSKNGDK